MAAEGTPYRNGGGGGGRSAPIANVILASALSALVVMLGAYFAFARNAVTRDELQTYVQTQSPFAHAQGQFEQMQLTLDRIEAKLEILTVHNQHQDDQIARLIEELKALQRAELRNEHRIG